MTVLTAMVSACIHRCCARIFRRKDCSGMAGNPFAIRGDIAAWLSLLHRVTTVAVFMALGLALVLVGASIIVAACSCYERIILVMQGWGAFAAGS